MHFYDYVQVKARIDERPSKYSKAQEHDSNLIFDILAILDKIDARADDEEGHIEYYDKSGEYITRHTEVDLEHELYTFDSYNFNLLHGYTPAFEIAHSLLDIETVSLLSAREDDIHVHKVILNGLNYKWSAYSIRGGNLSPGRAVLSAVFDRLITLEKKKK